MNQMLKHSSAWVPIVMSLFAWLLVVGYISIYGIHKNVGDEGLFARIFQILILSQIPIIAYFVFTHFYKKPKQTLIILKLQLISLILPVAIVIFLEL